MVDNAKMGRIMTRLGFFERHNGTECLREGINRYRRGIYFTKELYPAIAAAVESTPGRVERNMRHAIEAAWSRGDREAQLEYFGAHYEIGQAPAVGEFVAQMARLCRVAEGQE